jgi:alpha-mannosidase
MIAAESTTVPSRSKRTTRNLTGAIVSAADYALAVPPVSHFRYLVVPHTHWDREWYLPFEQFRLLLGGTIDGVLDTLERDPAFRSFTLDGQAIVLEDYVEVRPEHEGRLRALLAAGRLEVGPSYVLPDELLAGGEPLIRNFLLGRRVCRRFGVEPSTQGYLPDSFGHPAQLPQILAGFGIGSVLFSRGLGDELDDVGVVFRWRAGGAEIVACQMLPHYDNFARLGWYRDAEERVQSIVERFGELVAAAGVDTILLANGSDHLPIEPELPSVCESLERGFGTEFRIGRYSEFAPAPEGLPVHEGELVGSRLQNVLRGVNSARIYLKQANERAERRLLAVETVAALRTLSEAAPFPTADLRLAWRDLLRNHPHDSICGCSCDEVHRDMLVRYEQLDRTLDLLERHALGVGSALVNTLPYPRRRLVDDALVKLDGFTGARPEPLPTQEETLRVEVSDDGTLSVSDLVGGVSLEGLLVFEDEPDEGDLYTFCPGGPRRRARFLGSRVERDDGLVRELVLEHELPGIRLETLVRVVHGIDRVEFETTVVNESDDHRLRVLFPVGSEALEVRAESQFAVARRPLEQPRPRADWIEPPVSTAHMLGTVALGQLALLTKGLPEYEAGPDGLRLTLLRCVGTISRPAGMATRPVSAGPEIPTPDGQCRGTHVLEYALRLDAERLSDAALVRAGQDYRTDFLAGDPFEPPLALDGDLVFSAFKGAEDGNGLVLRVFNPNARPETLSLNVEAKRIRLDEEADAAGGFELAANEIATFVLDSRS